MAKTTRTRTKELMPEINSIRVKTEELKQIVEALPSSGVKDAFTYSVENLEKKILKFTKNLTVGEVLTDEEKEVIRKFRESKTSTENPSPEKQVSTIQENVVKPPKKGKKN